jgi:hypothetical protein
MCITKPIIGMSPLNDMKEIILPISSHVMKELKDGVQCPDKIYMTLQDK